MEDKLPRGVTILDKEQTLWRKIKCKELLNIHEAGPYMYAMDASLPTTYIPHDTFPDHITSITKSSIHVLFHRGDLYRVKPWAFKRFWGDGQYYCTFFDDTFDWFFFTDDNSEDLNRVVAYYRNENYLND